MPIVSKGPPRAAGARGLADGAALDYAVSVGSSGRRGPLRAVAGLVVVRVIVVAASTSRVGRSGKLIRFSRLCEVASTLNCKTLPDKPSAEIFSCILRGRQLFSRASILRMIAIAITTVQIGAHAEESPDSRQSKTPTQDQHTPDVAPVVDKIDVKPGDRWTYQVIDDVTGDTKSTAVHTVTEIRNKTFSVQSVFTPYGQSVGTTTLQVFDDQWKLLEDSIWTRDPADPSTGIQLPLKVGAQWKTHFITTKKTPPEAHLNVEAITKVVAYEPVMLKFNTYDAFKLEVNEALTNSAAPSSVITIKSTMWFAPSVNRYVKRMTEARVNDRLQSRNLELLTVYARRHDDD